MNRNALELGDVVSLPITYEAQIPESYLDEMGHMNVMWYTHLFSQAMGGLFEIVGLAWEELLEINAGTFALESHIRYLSEVRAGQTIETRTRFVNRSAKRFHVVHFMLNRSKDDLSATFEVVGAYMDMTQRRMAPIPDDAAHRMDQLISAHQQLPWPAPLCGAMAP